MSEIAPQDISHEISADWHDRISTDMGVCHGKVCIRGTRIMVSVVLDNLAEGQSVENIVKAYPSLGAEDVYAAIAYAAEVLRDEMVLMPEAAR